jgi:hypothetical protein
MGRPFLVDIMTGVDVLLIRGGAVLALEAGAVLFRQDWLSLELMSTVTM